MRQASDLMALQILARLTPGATDLDKIREMSRFIFYEMQFRFPPHSLYAKDIDLYTFLPSVLDSRQGVCLGVSILYLAIAQRLNVPLEIVTPPGHIYVRYNTGDDVINIETTARGVHMPSDVYLGIDTRSLQMRTLKEVIGLAFVNQASVAWGKEEYGAAILLYEKALPYLKNDPLLKMLLGLNYLFVGKKSAGKKLLQEIRNITFEEAVSRETIPEDLLTGKIDAEGIKTIFLPVDETRTSIIEKQKELQRIIAHYPYFRAGLFQLAVASLQLGRGSEALQMLQRYHRLDATNAVVEYYLTILCMERYDYNRAWDHYKQTQALLEARSHHPKALKDLKGKLPHPLPYLLNRLRESSRKTIKALSIFVETALVFCEAGGADGGIGVSLFSSRLFRGILALLQNGRGKNGAVPGPCRQSTFARRWKKTNIFSLFQREEKDLPKKKVEKAYLTLQE